MLRCSARYWRQHIWQAVLMLIGLALGVAVVFSVDIANQSAKRAFALSLDAITGRTTHQIIGAAAGIDESIYTQLRRDFHLRQSAPVVEGAITLHGPTGRETLQLLGVDLFAEPMFRTQLDSLSDQGNGGVSARESLALLEFGTVIVGDGTAGRIGLEVGDIVKATVAGKSFDVTLINKIDTRRQAAFDSIAMTDISTAQSMLSMTGKLSRIDLIIENQAQLTQLSSALKNVSIVDAARRNNTLQQMTQAFHTNLLAMSLLALLVGAILIYNTVMLSVLQRRLLFGQLRVAGVDRQALATAIVVEVMAFAIVGMAIGLILGYLLGGVLLNLVTRTINDLYFTVEVRRLELPLLTVAKVVGMALVTTLVAVAVPAREAANSPPVTLIQRSSLESKASRLLPWLAVLGVVGGATGVFILLVSASLLMAFVALFLIVFGYSLLIPISLQWLMILREKLPFSGAGVTGHYTMRSLSLSLSRTAVAVTALTVAVSATAGVGIMIGSFRASVADWLDQTLQADVYIRDGESLDNALPQGFITAIDQLGAIEGMRLARSFDVDADGAPARLLALQFVGDIKRGLSFIESGNSRREPWRDWGGADAVFISEPLAWQLSLEPGQQIPVGTETGVVNFTIAGVFTDYGAGRGLIIVPMATMHQYWGDRSISAVGVVFSSQVTGGEGRIRQLVQRWPELLMRTDQDIRQLSMRIFDQTFSITHILRLLTTGVAFIGILSALLALTLERRREYAVLRALGTTPFELRRVLFSQTAWMGMVAGLLALPLGILMSAILVAVINRRSFGWTMQYTVSPSVLWESLMVAVIAAVIAALYPAWRLGRMHPSDALRDR